MKSGGLSHALVPEQPQPVDGRYPAGNAIATDSHSRQSCAGAVDETTSDAAIAEIGYAGAEIVDSGALPIATVVESPDSGGTDASEADGASA